MSDLKNKTLVTFYGNREQRMQICVEEIFQEIYFYIREILKSS